MKRKTSNEERTNACRPFNRHASESERCKDLRNSKAQRSLAGRLKKAVNEAMEETIRRFACLSCAALFCREDIERTRSFTCKAVRMSKGFKHVDAAKECYPRFDLNVGHRISSKADINVDEVLCAYDNERIYINVCKWCVRQWPMISDVEDGANYDEISVCPTLNPVPWNEIPEVLKTLGDMESTALSCVGLRAKIVFGAGSGNVHDAICGDFKYGEDAGEGREGLLCGQINWTSNTVAELRACLEALLVGQVRNPYVITYLTSAELWVDGSAGGGEEPVINPLHAKAFHVDGRAEVEDVGAVFRTGLTRLWKTKKVVNSTIAGRCQRRSSFYSNAKMREAPEEITFDMDVEGRAFTCLYVDGNGSWDSRD